MIYAPATALARQDALGVILGISHLLPGHWAAFRTVVSFVLSTCPFFK